MNSVYKFIRKNWLMGVVAAILVILFFKADRSEIVHTFVNVSWGWVSLAILANFASIMLKVTSWKVIFDASFDNIRGRWIDLTSALMIGFLVNIIIPARMGELARAYIIQRRQSLEGKPVSSSTVLGTIVLERVFDGIAMAMIVIYGVTRMNLPSWADRGAVVLMVVSFFFAAMLIVLESKRERLKANAEAEELDEIHSWPRRQFIRFRGVIARFSEGQRVLRYPGRVALISVTTVCSWMAQLLAVYFTLNAFHIGLAGILGALMLLILINIAGAMPATPGNVGIFQLATVIPLTVTYDEITYSMALAFSIGLQIIEGSIGAGFGSIFLVREGLSFRQVREESINELRTPGNDQPLEQEVTVDTATGSQPAVRLRTGPGLEANSPKADSRPRIR
jgi:phosphatidylinositol alpha-mannosyltransferase